MQISKPGAVRVPTHMKITSMTITKMIKCVDIVHVRNKAEHTVYIIIMIIHTTNGIEISSKYNWK